VHGWVGGRLAGVRAALTAARDRDVSGSGCVSESFAAATESWNHAGARRLGCFRAEAWPVIDGAWVCPGWAGGTLAVMLVSDSAFYQQVGQGWAQFGDLALAFGLASLIGFERETRQRSAGLRTYTLVGFGAALFMLVSKYGFGDILEPRTVVLDPSRIAAQIVTGIGFIGGGLIFVRRDAVRGLTTAAAVWVTAGIGMACGAGLPLLAVAATGGYFVVVLVYTPLVHRLPGGRFTLTQLRLEYVDQRGVLRRALEVCTTHGFTVGDLAILRGGTDSESRGRDQRRDRAETDSIDPSLVHVTMTVHGSGQVTDLISLISDLDDVVAVSAGDLDDE